jgi:hypothetical protein
MPRKKSNYTGKKESGAKAITTTVNTFAALMDDDVDTSSSGTGSSSQERSASKSGSASHNSGSNISHNASEERRGRSAPETDENADSDGFVTVGNRRRKNKKITPKAESKPEPEPEEDGWIRVGAKKSKGKKKPQRDYENNDYGERIEKNTKSKSGSYEKPKTKYVFNPSSRYSSSSKSKYNRYNKNRSYSYQKNDDREYTDAQYYEPEEGETTKGDEMSLNTPWKVWIHANNTDNWGLDSYDSGSKIETVGQILRFLYDFESLDKRNYQYFVMRNEIAPIWEDINNKDGVITSIKINLGNRDDSYDIGSMAFKVICLLVLNEAFVKNNTDINGVCFSIKNNSPHIKIWVKDRTRNGAFEKGLPMALLRQFENLVESNRRYNSNYYRGGARPVSVLTRNIKPDE